MSHPKRGKAGIRAKCYHEDLASYSILHVSRPYLFLFMIGRARTLLSLLMARVLAAHGFDAIRGSPH
jgi:hypothetical protein